MIAAYCFEEEAGTGPLGKEKKILDSRTNRCRGGKGREGSILSARLVAEGEAMNVVEGTAEGTVSPRMGNGSAGEKAGNGNAKEKLITINTMARKWGWG